MGRITVARVYDAIGSEPSGRFLVDRLWPRGLAKADAPFEFWAKEVGPSTELRTWYGHDPPRFEAFSERYRTELAQAPGRDALADLRRRIADRHAVLLTATKDLELSHLAVLAEVLSLP